MGISKATKKNVSNSDASSLALPDVHIQPEADDYRALYHAHRLGPQQIKALEAVPSWTWGFTNGRKSDTIIIGIQHDKHCSPGCLGVIGWADDSVDFDAQMERSNKYYDSLLHVGLALSDYNDSYVIGEILAQAAASLGYRNYIVRDYSSTRPGETPKGVGPLAVPHSQMAA